MPLNEASQPELELLLERYVPDMASRWSRASDADIAALETLAGGPLPDCYLWMLQRLGRGWSDIAYGSLDLSARTVVQAHARELFPPHEGRLGIGIDTDPWQPQLRYLDLEAAADGDAPVLVADPDDGELSVEYETLRAFIGVAAFNGHRLRPMPVKLEGVFLGSDGSAVLDELEPLVEDLGFRSPLATGAYCTIYDDGEVALSSYCKPSPQHRFDVLPFRLGADTEAALRKLLGIITTSTDLVTHDLVWMPAVG